MRLGLLACAAEVIPTNEEENAIAMELVRRQRIGKQ